MWRPQTSDSDVGSRSSRCKGWTSRFLDVSIKEKWAIVTHFMLWIAITFSRFEHKDLQMSQIKEIWVIFPYLKLSGLEVKSSKPVFSIAKIMYFVFNEYLLRPLESYGKLCIDIYCSFLLWIYSIYIVTGVVKPISGNIWLTWVKILVMSPLCTQRWRHVALPVYAQWCLCVSVCVCPIHFCPALSIVQATKHGTLTQCWANVGPPSMTLSQH